MSGNDIYSKCLAVDEYRTLSWCRTAYRAVLHPVISLMLPPLVFLVIDPDVALRPADAAHDIACGMKREEIGKNHVLMNNLISTKDKSFLL